METPLLLHVTIKNVKSFTYVGSGLRYAGEGGLGSLLQQL